MRVYNMNSPAALASSTPLSSTSSVCREGGTAEGEEEGDDREKFDLIHRKREMVKNYGKKMFRKVCYSLTTGLTKEM